MYAIRSYYAAVDPVPAPDDQARGVSTAQLRRTQSQRFVGELLIAQPFADPDPASVFTGHKIIDGGDEFALRPLVAVIGEVKADLSYNFV